MRSFKSAEAAADALLAHRQPVPPVHGESPCARGDRRQLLSGCNWRFKLFESPADVPDDFAADVMGGDEDGGGDYCEVGGCVVVLIPILGGGRRHAGSCVGKDDCRLSYN